MTLSLADLKIAADSIKVEMLDEDGNASGVILDVVSSHSDAVIEKSNALEDERRRKLSIREAKAAKARGNDPVFESAAESQAYVRKAAAIRVAGWNLKEEPTEANIVELFKLRPSYVLQVLDAANETGRFTKSSPKAS